MKQSALVLEDATTSALVEEARVGEDREAIKCKPGMTCQVRLETANKGHKYPTSHMSSKEDFDVMSCNYWHILVVMREEVKGEKRHALIPGSWAIARSPPAPLQATPL